MFGLFKKKKSKQQGSKEPVKDMDEEQYAIEWRIRYLCARLKHLKEEIEKAGGYVGSIETVETDLELKQAFLAAKVAELEKLV